MAYTLLFYFFEGGHMVAYTNPPPQPISHPESVLAAAPSGIFRSGYGAQERKSPLPQALGLTMVK